MPSSASSSGRSMYISRTDGGWKCALLTSKTSILSFNDLPLFLHLLLVANQDKTYLNALKNHLPRLVDLFNPDFMFYLAGVDVLKTDKLGRLGLTIAGCKARDRFVLNFCKQQNIPVQVSMGGGYSVNLNDIINAHSNTFELAQDIFF